MTQHKVAWAPLKWTVETALQLDRAYLPGVEVIKTGRSRGCRTRVA